MKELPAPTFSPSSVALPRRSLHQGRPTPGAPDAAKPGRGGLRVGWARHQDEVRQAQRLRHSVFAGEMGARLSTPLQGHDIDLFDDFCEHLLVRDECSHEVIGTYRVLTPTQARRIGGTYSDTEFDLTRLPLPVDQLDDTLAVEPPGLIRGYLRLGAKVLGPPAWDPDFNSADLPLFMRMQDMPPRYQRHFLDGI